MPLDCCREFGLSLGGLCSDVSLLIMSCKKKVCRGELLLVLWQAVWKKTHLYRKTHFRVTQVLGGQVCMKKRDSGEVNRFRCKFRENCVVFHHVLLCRPYKSILLPGETFVIPLELAVLARRDVLPDDALA